VALVLETLRSNQSLDLGCLGERLLALNLGLNLAADNVLANVIVLGEIEELADLGGPLGSEPLGVGDVGKTGDFGLALLDDGEGENGQIGTDDASTDGLPLALTSATGTVARSTLGEEQLDTVGQQNTLLHGETLLVVHQ